MEQYHHWRSQYEDAEAICELLELDDDPALLTEALENLDTLQKELDRWELQQMLSGEYDPNGAVLTINAGAGGTDAQDWAEMLLRMYTRWGEKQGYKVRSPKFPREKKPESNPLPSKSKDAMPLGISKAKKEPTASSEFPPLTLTINDKLVLLALKSCPPLLTTQSK